MPTINSTKDISKILEKALTELQLVKTGFMSEEESNRLSMVIDGFNQHQKTYEPEDFGFTFEHGVDYQVIPSDPEAFELYSEAIDAQNELLDLCLVEFVEVYRSL
ncbi:MAG: hypothetical protein PF440_07915 [Thiomicrorhabdus sp.]|jgi:polysaccharide deacetylase 2 family uncharacterized protein YibQ|nr:hypothetical protein [Thiomicrorhabdus sp.]